MTPTLATNTGSHFFWGAVLVGTNLVATVVNSASIPSYTLIGTNTSTTNSQYIGAYTMYSEPIVSDGSYFYVNDEVFGYLQKYTLKGSLVTPSLVSEPSGGSYMAIDGTNLYVANPGANTIAKYSTSGVVISTNLISGLNSPSAVAADGQGHLFVTSYNNGTIGEFTTSGAVINASLVTGLSNPHALAVDLNPTLNISETNTTIYVSWVSSTNFSLQTNSSPYTTNWIVDTNVGVTNGLDTATTPASNQLFFRLQSTNGF